MLIKSIESLLIDIFKNRFTLETIDPSWNFFDLGINSIELSQICIELSKALNKEINILVFYEFPTISSVAKELQTS
jgi:acyl carrier protein